LNGGSVLIFCLFVLSCRLKKFKVPNSRRLLILSRA
jgi:hypothetical protein